MSSEEIALNWITKKTNEGKGAVIFCLEENNGYIGVWIGEPEEGQPALGYGETALDAVLDAASSEIHKYLLDVEDE